MSASERSVTTFCLFRFSGVPDKWRFFREMGMPFDHVAVPGLLFFKKVGTGSDGGFSIWPNFSVYGWLAVWENASHAEAFFDQHEMYQNWRDHAVDLAIIFLETIRAHGTWHGHTPFMALDRSNFEGKVGVITRARVKTKFLPHFWRQVPAVQKRSAQSSGRLFSVGFGELPILELATFSIWQDEDCLNQFAYRSKEHTRAVKDTRRLDWYSEELFARFRILEVRGDLGNF